MTKHCYKKQDGFTVLLVLCTTSIITIIGLACWYQSSLRLDVITERERYYKNFYTTSCALDAAIILASKNFDLFSKQLSSKRNPRISLDLSFMLKNSTTTTIVTLERFENKPRVLVITAQTSACLLRCLLIKQKKEKIKKEEDNGENKHGAHDKQRDKQRDKEQYLVQHFTIGNLL